MILHIQTFWYSNSRFVTIMASVFESKVYKILIETYEKR